MIQKAKVSIHNYVATLYTVLTVIHGYICTCIHMYVALESAHVIRVNVKGVYKERSN